MDQEQDIFYCNDPKCKEPVKILTSFAQIADKHNVLRSELQQHANYGGSDPLNQESNDDKQDLITYIDDQVESLKQSFLVTIQRFGDHLKQFVNENLTSQKRIQMLFKAVMENNAENIGLYQDHLEFLKKDDAYFQEYKEILVLVREQLALTFKTTGEKIAEMDKLNLPKPSIFNIPFTWSNINKHALVSLLGKIAKSQQSGAHNTVLLDPKLDFQQTKSFRLKIVTCSYMMIMICDLKMIKSKCPDFQNIYQDGHGAYSHHCNGLIYATDTYGQGQTNSFKFAVGDVLELQWNGPQKKFTTLKVSTDEKFVFDVKLDMNAEIYFGISFYNTDSVELV